MTANLQTCLKDITFWMSHNFLMLNSEKTEVTVLGPKHIHTHYPVTLLIWMALAWATAPLSETWVLSLTRSCLSTHMLNRSQGRPSLTACLNKMQKI